jgi:DNA-binding CsgD family transcriptional regulator
MSFEGGRRLSDVKKRIALQCPFMPAIVRCRKRVSSCTMGGDQLSKLPPLLVISTGTRPGEPSTENPAPEFDRWRGQLVSQPSEGTVSIAPGVNGFLLLDTGLNLIAANDPALQILCFPSKTDRIKQPKVFLADQVRATLRDHKHQDGPAFVKEFRSGKRRYICTSFRLDYGGCDSSKPLFAVLLERNAAGSVFAEVSQRFDLTQRERETVGFLLQGFTSKQIATRMNISPNTVKAFLRLVMVKMKVSTRSGIAGKIAGSKSNAVCTTYSRLAANSFD